MRIDVLKIFISRCIIFVILFLPFITYAVDSYYVNKKAQRTGEHEMHLQGCSYFHKKRLYVGEFSDCHDAIGKALEIYHDVDGCYRCMNECHTK